MEQGDNELGEALALMKRALACLDQAGAPPDLGAHLDFAITLLEELVAGCGEQEKLI